MKYKEWLHDWLELYEKESVKPRTYKQYEDVINKRLIPALGDYEMEDLSPIILQRYIVDLSQKGNTKTGKGLAPNSVNCIILVLHSSLSMAYVLGLSIVPVYAILTFEEVVRLVITLVMFKKKTWMRSLS